MQRKIQRESEKLLGPKHNYNLKVKSPCIRNKPYGFRFLALKHTLTKMMNKKKE